MSYLPYLERILAGYSTGDDLEVVMEARSVFGELSGRVSEEDPWNETFSQLFLDWFGFDFPVAGHPSPVHRFVAQNLEALMEQGELSIFRGLMCTHRSVFEVGSWSKGQLYLVDIIGMGRYRVFHPFPLGGIQKGDIIDARIVPLKGVLTLGAGIIFHPEDSVGLIHELVDRLRQDGQLSFKVVHLLARMNLQHLQGPSLKLRSIYSPKSFLIRSYT